MAENVKITKDDLSKQLNILTTSLGPKDREATLSTLRRIFDNIIQHPNDEKYRQIKLAGKTFNSKVWQYPAGEELMKISGWVVEGDYVRLQDNICVQAIFQLLEQELKGKTTKPTSHPSITSSASILAQSKDILYDGSACATCGCNSLETCFLTSINNGNGIHFKEKLEQFDTNFVRNAMITLDGPLIDVAFRTRQIGIARILVNEYGVDINCTDEDGSPYFLSLFIGSDSNELDQSLIIQFFTEFKIEVDKQSYVAAIHHAILHKLFTVVEFLVEDCKVDLNCKSSRLIGGTPLHMAYGIGEENIAKYLIDHGADQEAVDDNGRKPQDYKFYRGASKNFYSKVSIFFIKRQVICRSLSSPEFTHYNDLLHLGILQHKAVDLTFEKFPSLQKHIDSGFVNHQNLEAIPTLNELNHYITDMAPSYDRIGLELDVVNSQIKLIRNDPSLPGLEEKCLKMLEVWLENDTSATWKKLCDALEETGQSVLAERIAKAHNVTVTNT